MENNTANILEQIRQRIDELQKELDALKAQVGHSTSFDEPVDISFDDMPESLVAPKDLQSEPAPEPEPEPESVLVPEPALEPAQEPASEPAPEPEQSHTKPRYAKPAVAWRVDIPGSPVSNIISGISLNDRVLFINTLFKEDPMLFQSTINALNMMSGLDDAEDYIMSHFPDWNISSDIVYRLMMAVRRKLR